MNKYQICIHIATLYVLYEVCTYKFCNRTLQCLKFERSVQFWLKITILCSINSLISSANIFPLQQSFTTRIILFQFPPVFFSLYCLSSSTWSSKFPPIFLANCAAPLSRSCDPTTFAHNPLRLFRKSPRLPTLHLPS